MNYESAWLNDDIRAKIKNVTRIDTIVADVGDVTQECDRIIVRTAVDEMKRDLIAMFGHEPIVKYEHFSGAADADGTCVVLSLNADNAVAVGEADGAYAIEAEKNVLRVMAATARGLLYGVFKTVFGLKTCDSAEDIACAESPASNLRMLNHWDNLDGSIERGYSGNSFFFENNKVIIDDRTVAYARMIASVGINAVVINNVNVKAAATKLITHEYRAELKQLVEIFGRYGIGTYLSLNFAAPIELGGLDTCDPCSEKVAAWWKETLDELFTDVPEFKGFLIKADSEGRPGPFTYGRNHAEGANMLADIVAPHGGIIIWRCFVYNCKQDWRDTVTDRAKAQYDNFRPLDGMFRDNVILQIKNGPMDFQTREPVSPLFGGLNSTNMMIEFQIAQEYTGQQRHVCYLIPEFKEVLEFKTYITDKNGNRCEKDSVEDLVTGRTFGNVNNGMVAVTNTGNDANWTGHDLAAANLYGFGRLAFNPALSSEDIAKEWIGLTFGDDDDVFHIILYILSASWPAYEKYTAPLGVGWMVNPSQHYGPNVDGYEFSEWGTYHRSDSKGMGVDRSSTGTDYVHQYNEPNASMYEKLETCPDELLLFMHHVPYTYRLHSGKTVIQHIYDTHFEGALDAVKMREAWQKLEGKINPTIYLRVLKRMTHQVESAAEWRDHINGYYRRKSGIADEAGRI